jgi:hypothetical protein
MLTTISPTQDAALTVQYLHAIEDHAGALGRALKSICPLVLPATVAASLDSLKGAYVALILAESQDCPAGVTTAQLALAELAREVLAATPVAMMPSLPPKAQDAAVALQSLFTRP